MLLAHRRRGLIHLCLAGMDVAWFTPFVLLALLGRDLTWSPLRVYLALLAGLVLWMLALEVLNRSQLESPRYELAVVGLILLSSLLAVRIWLHGGSPPADFGWMRSILSALFNLHRELRPEVVLLLANVFLWQRAANATSREMTFFRISLSFRLGILLLMAGAGWLSYRLGANLSLFLWLYFGSGLTAVALARIDDKAGDAVGGAGPVLPLRRLGQLLLAVGAALGAAAGLSVFYTPDRLRAVLAWLGPVWTLLGRALVLIIQVVFWLLTPLLIWLERFLSRLFEQVDFSRLNDLLDSLGANAENERPVEQGQSAIENVPPWVWTSLRYAAVALVLLVLVGFVLLYLERVRARRARSQAEAASAEGLSYGGGILGEGLSRLRQLAGLVRRYGLSRQLLAAISVENIYANLCRLARQQGHPRRPAQPPDDYLPVLARVFPGQDDRLNRITLAYMQVHYGDQPVSSGELARLRTDYRRLREEMAS
ncbi:MAG: DUF4129 domain-containing protein [Anaerolineae bacterium]